MASKTNSRQKGARAERQAAKALNQHLGCSAYRGRQYQGTDESPDVANAIPHAHPEVKHVERLNVYDAIRQAEAEAGNQTPYVVHRRNFEDWCVTVRLEDLMQFCECIASVSGQPIFPVHVQNGEVSDE